MSCWCARRGGAARGAAERGTHPTPHTQTNTTLEVLELNGNVIDLEGAGALAEALAANSTLRTLGLSDNYLQAAGAELLAAALKENTSLQVGVLCVCAPVAAVGVAGLRGKWVWGSWECGGIICGAERPWTASWSGQSVQLLLWFTACLPVPPPPGRPAPWYRCTAGAVHQGQRAGGRGGAGAVRGAQGAQG